MASNIKKKLIYRWIFKIKDIVEYGHISWQPASGCLGFTTCTHYKDHQYTFSDFCSMQTVIVLSLLFQTHTHSPTHRKTERERVKEREHAPGVPMQFHTPNFFEVRAQV